MTELLGEGARQYRYYALRGKWVKAGFDNSPDPRAIRLKYGHIGADHAGEPVPHLHRADKTQLFLTEEMTLGFCGLVEDKPRSTRPIIVLTGGPGGGKTTLIDELLHDPMWGSRVAALPEAISLMRHLNISPRERLFQRVMVHLQLSLEDGLNRALGPDDPRTILCHRGTLDPLAYWLDRGWPEDEFFAFTETQRQDLYRRYTAVIHLVMAAAGAAWAYKKWPEAHRPEGPPDAIRIDRLLQLAWGGHPNYFCIDNEGRDWRAKSTDAQRILASIFDSST